MPRRKESGDELQDVLSDFINAFCLSEHRIEEMLSRPDYESEIPSSQDWLHVIFRAAIYGIIPYMASARAGEAGHPTRGCESDEPASLQRV